MEHKHKLRAALLAENYQRTFTASLAFLLLGTTLMTYDFAASVVQKPMGIFGALIASIALARGTITYLGLHKKISQYGASSFLVEIDT